MQISGKNINLKEYIELRVKQEKQKTYKKRRLLTLVYLTLRPPYIITTLIILYIYCQVIFILVYSKFLLVLKHQLKYT